MRICVFCGSSPGRIPAYAEAAAGLLDVQGYYSRMAPFLDHMVAEGFLRRSYRDALQVDTDAVALLQKLATVRLPESKWSEPAPLSVPGS